MPYSDRQYTIAIILSIRRNPWAGRIIQPHNISPLLPSFFLRSHQLRSVEYMQNYRFIFITDTPSKNRSMITISKNKTRQMFFRSFPEKFRIQLRTAITSPVSSFIQHTNTHFIRNVQVKTGINLCMRTNRISIHTFNSCKPSPSISTSHLRNPHKMPRVTSQLIRFTIQTLNSTIQCPLTPTKTLIFYI